MKAIQSLQTSLGDVGRAGLGWSASWWHVIHVGALILVLALSPSSYHRANRVALARHVHSGAAPILPWFALLSALISLVLIRIVVVTAMSYGLSQYAVEMVVRVLVIELIPLTAALFVALRVTMPSGAELGDMHAKGELHALQAQGVDPVRRELLPRVVAGIFAVALLAAVSCALAMLLAYLMVYGFTMGGVPAFTRTVGQIFNPGVAMIFALKTLLFSLAVSLIPVAAFLRGRSVDGTRTSAELRSLVRMFSAIVLIEVGSLMSNYA